MGLCFWKHNDNAQWHRWWCRRAYAASLCNMIHCRIPLFLNQAFWFWLLKLTARLIQWVTCIKHRVWALRILTAHAIRYASQADTDFQTYFHAEYHHAHYIHSDLLFCLGYAWYVYDLIDDARHDGRHQTNFLDDGGRVDRCRAGGHLFNDWRCDNHVAISGYFHSV